MHSRSQIVFFTCLQELWRALHHEGASALYDKMTLRGGGNPTHRLRHDRVSGASIASAVEELVQRRRERCGWCGFLLYFVVHHPGVRVHLVVLLEAERPEVDLSLRLVARGELGIESVAEPAARSVRYVCVCVCVCVCLNMYECN